MSYLSNIVTDGMRYMMKVHIFQEEINSYKNFALQDNLHLHNFERW